MRPTKSTGTLGGSDTVYVILDAYVSVLKKDFTDFFHPQQVC